MNVAPHDIYMHMWRFYFTFRMFQYWRLIHIYLSMFYQNHKINKIIDWILTKNHNDMGNNQEGVV